jgi:fucose 4-O-acetylase-like acetyltransferase
MLNKRQIYFDVLKGLAIIAVVFSHTVHGITDMRFLPLHSMGYSFWYVSVFFLLSGFFLKEDRLNK